MSSPTIFLLLVLASDTPAAAGEQRPRNPPARVDAKQHAPSVAATTRADEQERRYAADVAEANRQVIELTAEIAAARQPSAELYEERADCYMFLGLPVKAIDDYSQALALETNAAKRLSVFRNRIMARIRGGQYQLAINEAESLCRVQPSPAEDLAVLALLLAKSPNRPKADRTASLDIAKEARREQHPGEKLVGVLVERALASAYSANGDFKSAIEHQKNAIEAMGDHVPSSAREELAAYEAGKEFPYPAKEVREAPLEK